jgi:serine O-acetyltransferase
LDSCANGPLKWILTMGYWVCFRIVETLTGISLPKSAIIGPGLRIWHFGNIFIHPDVTIGANCTLRQGVTIGNRHEGGPVPTVGENVEIGAYAQVLGSARIGNNCRIGAMSVVLDDVPDGATVVGIPAQVVQRDSVMRV